MENLNAEQVKKALECCIKAECWGDCQELGCPASTKYGCHFYLRTDDDNENVLYIEMLKDALALINSQEQRIGELTEENERLRGILLQFTDIVHKWGNKNGYDTSEISLVPILNEATAIKSQIKADTVRKMQERLKAEMSFGRYIQADQIDQIAKEMLEGE